MAKILSLSHARAAKQNRIDAFRQAVKADLYADLHRKREIMLSLGNPSAAIIEGDGAEHITLYFTGTGSLRGCAFGFAVSFDDNKDMLRAEIFVHDSASKDIFSKTISNIELNKYSQCWLNEAYHTALDIIAPQQIDTATSEISNG